MPTLGNFTIDYELKMLDKEPYNEKIKTLIKKFVNELKIKENISEIRRINYVQRLRVVARWIPDKFLRPDKEAMERVLEKLANSNYSDYTRETYVIMIKRFYKWYLGDNKIYPSFLDGIKIKVNHTDMKPESLITPDELSALVNACVNVRDRALFHTLYDSGARLGELLNMRIKDVGFDEYGAILKVVGKTGYRQIRIVGNSIAYLRAWLDNHPDRNNREAYLFCGLSENTMGKQLFHSDVYAIIRRTVRRAGIKRRIHPHLFRHTRATILANKVTEAPLESQMGWVHGSKQTRTYVHLSLRDQDNAILKAYGVPIKEENTIKEDRPKECQRCHQLNPSDALYCRNCWMPFDIKEALEVKAKVEASTKALMESGILGDLLTGVLKKQNPNNRLESIVAIYEMVADDPEQVKIVREKLKSLLNK
ncbi:MAG: tyrosine-type recombinase/integrase [Candidatus Thermoplasmatota archaeon]|nr:tyrosine-type recombinase/integrase [Candidatus Thermoplasmatota archaeon]